MRVKLFNQATLNRFAGLLCSTTVRLWMGTLDYRAAFYDRTVDPAAGNQGQRIYVFWHEYILFPFFLRGNCNLTMLVSQHRDADILFEAARLLGFDLVRGSSYRGGGTALRELLRKSESMHLAITPDGPRGPRRRMAQGPIYLASKLGLPLVAMGFGYDRPWRTQTWDRFAVPRLHSRARAVLGPEMHIPADLDRDGIERYRQQVEQLLNRFTLEAEAWAEAGTHKVDEIPLHRQSAPRQRSVNEPHDLSAPHFRLTAKPSRYAADVDAAAR
jgi:lysophospholipid acyltransferase (LPLAT)-like uncharacterized protein